MGFGFVIFSFGCQGRVWVLLVGRQLRTQIMDWGRGRHHVYYVSVEAVELHEITRKTVVREERSEKRTLRQALI